MNKQLQFDAIGTKWHIAVEDPMESDVWQRLGETIHQRIDTFDKLYSRFREDSLVTEMSKGASSYDLPGDGFVLLEFYKRLYDTTQGKVTPLIGQVMSDAGYDKAYSLKPGRLQKPPQWEDAIHYDAKNITLAKPTLLDFGAAGKGYLIDIISDLIETAGVDSYLINAGGDILHHGEVSVRVGLENPFDTSEAIGTVELANKSICASATSKRQWAGLHHIIDPDSLLPTTNIAGTWVIANDTMTADGIATALFFCEAKTLLKKFEFAYAILASDGSLRHSRDFPIQLFAVAKL